MSSSEQFSDGYRKRSSNFTQTCNLLSQYIKEKGCLRDVNLEIARNLEASGKPDSSARFNGPPTMDFLTNMGKSGQELTQQFPSMDVLPQYVAPGPLNTFEDDLNKATFSKSTTTTEAKTSQMTIFYAGKVLVFDDFPADEAKEVIQLVTKSTEKITAAGGSVAPATEKVPNSGSKDVQEHLPTQPQPEPNGSDLPIARRSSLHRFLAKRKDRANIRAPYQLQNPSTSASSAKQLEQIDLNL